MSSAVSYSVLLHCDNPQKATFISVIFALNDPTTADSVHRMMTNCSSFKADVRGLHVRFACCCVFLLLRSILSPYSIESDSIAKSTKGAIKTSMAFLERMKVLGVPRNIGQRTSSTCSHVCQLSGDSNAHRAISPARENAHE